MRIPNAPIDFLVLRLTALLITCACPSCADSAESDVPPREEDPRAEVRRNMVKRDIQSSRGGRIPVKDKAVLEAMRALPRHEFVPSHLLSRAYGDYPLPIGHGQTISQPYIVAYMTEMLKLKPDHRVLEIGTGSGYQAAVCATIAKEVYTIEIVEPLGVSATKRFKRLGIDNVTAKVGDGYHGWPEHAPYDAIIVTAAASHIPPPLIEQLKPGGHMAIPVGPPFQTQYLMLLEKNEDGTVRQRNVMPVRFVPLTRAETSEADDEKAAQEGGEPAQGEEGISGQDDGAEE